MIKRKLVKFAFASYIMLTLYFLWGWNAENTTRETSKEMSETIKIDELHLDTVSTTAPKKPPLILYWGKAWGINGPDEGSLMDGCTLTYNRSKISDAIAVVFHFTMINKNQIPWQHYRDKKQIFVWWCGEGPGYFGKDGLREFDGGFFNWTWTFKRSADVLRYYGSRKEALTFVKKGKRAIDDLWGVTRCSGTNGAIKRMEYYKALVTAGLSITTFGGCFPDVENIPKQYPMLFEPKWREHKFYLAFENAIHCRDYITEKFWDNALKNDMVPVVWGPTKDDVLSVAPLNSFIHTDDFDSPAKLAEYLQFLDKNDDEYRKYFRWREDETMTDKKMIRMTQERYPDLNIELTPKSLCARLLENKETKIIPSVTDEFITSETPECLS
uniref:Fucosyltransferase n=1 Tax=Ciona intestinalis TaxID=7719 RepID=Q6A1F0_CIOIN|nr:alpha3-fucosyltransferase [Ciona intestinalis]CAH04967.1 alpha3-fucosyltransferase [Ciona intestinalis]|eukprot:NP_001027813.1 alpha3-fucosyltransferase [Ciona intestinalis]